MECVLQFPQGNQMGELMTTELEKFYAALRTSTLR